MNGFALVWQIVIQWLLITAQRGNSCPAYTDQTESCTALHIRSCFDWCPPCLRGLAFSFVTPSASQFVKKCWRTKERKASALWSALLRTCQVQTSNAQCAALLRISRCRRASSDVLCWLTVMTSYGIVNACGRKWFVSPKQRILVFSWFSYQYCQAFYKMCGRSWTNTQREKLLRSFRRCEIWVRLLL